MPMPRSLFVVVDPGMTRTPAVYHALEIARRAAASVHLYLPAFDLRIEDSTDLVAADVTRRAREHYLREREHWLAQWQGELTAKGQQVSCEVEWTARAHESLLSRIIDLKPDLVIKGVTHESIGRRWHAISALDSRLARLCPVALLMVQPTTSRLPRRIAVAVDPGPNGRSAGLDERVAQAAIPLALAADAPLELLHVFPYRPGDEGLSAQMDQLLERLRRADSEQFRALADQLGVPEDRRVLLGGKVRDALLQYVEEKKIDLLCIGGEYRGHFDHFFLGSVAEDLIAHARCDLLIARPDGFLDNLAKHHELPRGRP